MASVYGLCNGCQEYGQLTNARPNGGRSFVSSVVVGFCQSCLMSGVATPVVGVQVKSSNGSRVTDTRHATRNDLFGLGLMSASLDNIGVIPTGVSYQPSYDSSYGMLFGGVNPTTAFLLASLLENSSTNYQSERIEEEQRKQEQREIESLERQLAELKSRRR